MPSRITAASMEAADAVWDEMDSPVFRLPTYIAPVHYAVELQPNTAVNTFAGAVHITLRIVEAPPAPLTHLVLHTLDLNVTSASVWVFVPTTAQAVLTSPYVHPSQQRTATSPSKRAPYGDHDGRFISCVELRRSCASETLQLLFDSPLPSAAGDVFVLLIDRFDGIIDSGPKMVGLYHSSLTNPAVVSTHLEPTHTRRLFPCFDEPAIQSTFQLSVVTASTLTVLSNTEVEADTPLSVLPYIDKANRSCPLDAGTSGTAPSSLPQPAEEQPASPPSASSSFSSRHSASAATAAPLAPAAPWHCVRFQPTPPVHTCIVGFHVGRFNILEQRTRLSRALCRVVLPQTEPSSSGWFALDLATKALDFFEEFFDVRLPLKKLDVVAMERFAVLGMENWGMINLHKDYLIVTGTTPLERRQRITRLIGHETCHQWFGNWISIEWWNCLWLKEGMCRYLEYFFVDAVFPSWGLWNEFIGVIMNDALLADADPHQTHPVNFCDSVPRRIHDSFDTISYGKGACVLRMLFSIIGTEWLKRATHLLMTRFANKSFNATDLGDCIVQTADEHSSHDTQAQHVKAISYALQMVEAVSHPYLYIQQCPGEGYNITQYVAPSSQHGLLVEYLQSQRSKAGAPVIDLFSNPAHLAFEWKPEATLTRVSTPYSVPLRAAQWHRGGHGSVRLIFVDEAEHFVSFFGGASVGAGAPTGPSSPATSAYSGAFNASSSSPSKSGEQRDTPTSPISALQQVCYFNHGGSGFYQCEYDVATWRQLFDFVAAFSDEDRMAITLHFINTAKAQLGHQPGSLGDRCTLFFDWLLRLTNTPGAMNSFLWDVVTRALTHVVLLVQQYYCQSTVKAFVNGLYVPLQKRCVLSFFAQEKTVSFQSSIHLSRHLVLSILQLLCLCENPDVVDEAEETAQWALARVVPQPTDAPYHAGMAGSSGANSATAGGCTTATAAPLSMDNVIANSGNIHHHNTTTSAHSSGHRSAAPSPVVAASLGASARRPSQVESGSIGSTTNATTLHGTPPAGAAAGTKSSPVKVVVSAQAHPPTSSSAGSASRALPMPQFASTPHSNSNTNTNTNTNTNNNNNVSALDHNSANLFNSFGAPSGTTDWAGVRNNSIASYPYQRAAELNLADPSHLRAGEIALTHLASQGQMEHWVAAAAVAAEVLELDREKLQRLCGGCAVPAVRLSGLDRSNRDAYLRLVMPAVFSLDREALFPFMADVFQSLSFLSAAAVEALYRNSRFLVHLITAGLLSNRRVLNYVVTCGADICSNGFVIAQLKALTQGTMGNSESASSSVEMFKDVEFADATTAAGGAAEGNTETPVTSSCTMSQCTSSSTSAAPSAERSTLRVQSPAIASALDRMESNCVWMDYCCWHFDQFLRGHRQQKAWRPTRSEANSSMQMSAPGGDELDDGLESFGGVSI